MPYVARDEGGNIQTRHSVEQFCNYSYSVSSINCVDTFVTITLDSPHTMASDKITTAIVSGADQAEYNGKFTVSKNSDTEFTYTLPSSVEAKPSGNIKVCFALEYIADDHQEILDIESAQSDMRLINVKKKQIFETDYQVIRHNEEIAAGVAEVDRKLTQAEFDALHLERQTLREEIHALEAKLGN